MTETNSQWRWVVLVACFISTVGNSVFFYAFGTFVLYWIDAFSATTASVAAVASSGSAIAAMACPFGCFIVDKWGYRWTHVLGGIMMMMSFAASSLAQTLSQLFFTYSALGGLGCCFCMVSYVNAVSEHFHDQRPLAFALVTSAYGLGSFIFPLYFEMLIAEYNWRGAMLITSGFFGNMIACGLLLYPVRASPPFPILRCWKLKSKNSNTQRKSLAPLISEHGTDCYEAKITSSEDNISFGGNVQPNEKLVITSKDENDNFNFDKASSEKLSDDECYELGKNELTFFQIAKILFSGCTFYIVIAHNTILYMGYFIVLGLTTARASYDLNFTEEQAAQVVSTFGINAIFRILLGLLSKWKFVKSYYVYFSCFAIAGVLTLLSVFAKSFAMQIAYGVCCGALFAAITHYQVLVHEIYGAKFFNVAFGFLELMHGVGIVTGPIIGGILIDVTGSSVWTFIFAGSTILLATFLLPIGFALTGQIKKLNF
uniref:monocarboxylate transporter 9-like n=1 Tax=Styela clava TaxID=7725 RepID=UPI00193A05E7|nr:monocarboxylate transporter 9-like [Styela clava]